MTPSTAKPTTATPNLDRLTELDEQVAAARTKARATTDAAQAAKRNAHEAREALTEAFAQGDEKAAAALTKAKAKAEAVAAEPWAERTAGLERAANRVKSERDTWLTANIAGVLNEVAPGAHAVAERIAQLGQELALARKEWHRVDQYVTSLVAVAAPGAGVRSVTLHIDQLLRDIGRATAEGVPSPLPEGLARQTPPTVIPQHDPDPAIRESARAAAQRAVGRREAPIDADAIDLTVMPGKG